MQKSTGRPTTDQAHHQHAPAPMSEHKQSEQEWAGMRPSMDECWPAQINMGQHKRTLASMNQCRPAPTNMVTQTSMG